MEEKRKITVSVLVNADRGTAWKVFVDPRWITRWNFASPDWCCPRAENELRNGGAFNYRMESTDGRFGFDFRGTFIHVKERDRLEILLDDGRSVRLDFTDEGEATRVTESFEAENENSPELQRTGWQAILDNYKKAAEGKTP